jgi:hypothetical protein
VPAQVGVVARHHDEVRSPGTYLLLAAGAHVSLAGLGGVDSADLEALLVAESGQGDLVLQFAEQRVVAVTTAGGRATAVSTSVGGPWHAAKLAPRRARRTVGGHEALIAAGSSHRWSEEREGETGDARPGCATRDLPSPSPSPTLSELLAHSGHRAQVGSSHRSWPALASLQTPR